MVAGHHLAWTAGFAQRLETDVERADPECLDLVASAYSLAKGGLHALTRNLALELALP